jgi:serine/threonine-protein kinase
VLSGPELEGKYEILRKIREGGMGAVYEVRHRLLDERRVIKVIHPHLVASEELAERFRREARAASGLRHPNIAHLHDFSVDPDGRAYIIMELIEGLGLDEILRTQGPPPLGLGLEISRQALRAIGFLHRRGFLHRDVSPDNLMLTRDPEGAPLVKLIDLGIAKVLMEGGRGLTMAGTFLGKPRYASPEQLGAGEEIDGRSDLYSLGVVIYELLTGVCPIQGDNPSTLLASHLFQPPLDFAVSDPEGKLPPDLRDFLLKALAKKPEERFANAEEMRERLTEIQERFPCTTEDLDRVLVRPQDLDATAVLLRRGSTQDRLDRQFAKEETPGVVPIVPTERLESRPLASTEPVPVAPPTPVPPSPVPVVAPPRQPAPEETRRKGMGLGWIAAAVAVLALAVVAALFLRQDDAAVTVKEPVPSTTAPAREPASAEQQQPPPVEIASTQPISAVPDPAPPAREEAAKPPPKPEPKAAPPTEEKKPKPPDPRATSPKKPETDRKRSVAPAPPVTVPLPEGRKPGQKAREEDEEEISFVNPPVAVSVPHPTYPKDALGSGAKGKVVVAILVSEKGDVAEAKVASIVVQEGPQTPSGLDVKALFRDAAVAAARRARFEPATSDGVPTTFRLELTFEF